MTLVEDMGEFVARSAWEDASEQAREMLKVRVLDSIGCALGALESEPVRIARTQIDDFGGSRLCSLIGGGRTSPDYAALYNGALVRYSTSTTPTWPPARPATPATTSQPSSLLPNTPERTDGTF